LLKETKINIQDLIAVDKLWRDVFPYLVLPTMEQYGRSCGRVLELGPFSGGWTSALASSFSQMEFTVVDKNDDYLSYLKQAFYACGLSSRVDVVNSVLDKLQFPEGSFDMVLLRGAFFFIMECPQILQEIYRVLAMGGVALVGGGYGKYTPPEIINGIADESRVLNDRIGRRRVSLDQLRLLLHTQNLDYQTRISEEGGVWLIIKKRSVLAEEKVASLSQALELGEREVISLLGGGGKTSLLFSLAKELKEAGKRVITTTTTRIRRPSADDTPCLIIEADEEKALTRLVEEIAVYGHVTIARGCSDEGKLHGVEPDFLDRINLLHIAEHIINEADGAGGLPIKAPRQDEPVIPSSTSTVVALVGLEALDAPLSVDVAFRIDNIMRLTGLERGGIITEEAIATLLTQPQGIIQYSPTEARIIPFFNKADLTTSMKAESLVNAVMARCHPRINSVVAGSLRHYPASSLRVFHDQK